MGDGTTTVVLLAGEFLKECKAFVEEGVHPRAIAAAFRQAAALAVARVHELAVDIGQGSLEERKALLQKCAQTSLNSKLVGAAGAGRVGGRGGRAAGAGAGQCDCVLAVWGGLARTHPPNHRPRPTHAPHPGLGRARLLCRDGGAGCDHA